MPNGKFGFLNTNNEHATIHRKKLQSRKYLFYYRWKFCKHLNKLNISHDKISMNLENLDCNQDIFNTYM